MGFGGAEGFHTRQTPGGPPIGGGGTLNYIALFTPDGTHIGNSIMNQDPLATQVQIAGNFVPDSTLNARSLGTDTNRWDTIFMASNVDYASDLLFNSGGTQWFRMSTTGNLYVADNKGMDVEAAGSQTLNFGVDNALVINIGTGLNVKTINVGSQTTQLDNINIYGNIFRQEVTNLLVEDKLFTVNAGGAVASGFNAGFEIEEGGVNTGYFMTNTGRDGWAFKAPAVAFEAVLGLSLLTANRTYDLPNNSGTFALTSDLTGGTVTNVSAGNLAPLFTTNVANPTTTPALSFALSNAGANTWFGNNTGVAAAPAYNAAGDITRVNDTNVTLTLGGTPAGSTLNSVSFTLGWTGTLAVARGGTGVGTFGGVNTLLYTTAADTLSSIATANTSALVTSNTGVPSWTSGTTANRVLRTNGTAITFAQVNMATDVTGILAGANGGTGVANTGFTITIGGNLVTTGAFNTTFAAQASVTHTLPILDTTLVGTVFGNTANSAAIANTTTETTFSLTFNFPANSLALVGRQIRIKGWGTYGTAATAPTITTRLKTNATTLAATPAITMAGSQTGQGFLVEAIITVRTTGAGGTISRNLYASFNDGSATTERMSITASNGTTAFDTTIANTIGFSIQWSAANAANTITLENVTYEILK